MMELRGKTALVTGGGIRLGKAIVGALAQQGVNVAIHYNSSKEPALQVKQDALSCCVEAEVFQFDLNDFARVGQLVQDVNDWIGPIDILINNAGNYKKGSGLKTNRESLEETFNVNLFSPWWLTKAFAAQLPQDRQGKIVNICDAGIFRTATDHFAYRLTKKALFEMTRMFALELAPNITVNAIAPGIMLPLAGLEHLDMDVVAEKRKIPLNKTGSPEIIAENVLHILGQDFMTGSIIKIDGGENIV